MDEELIKKIESFISNLNKETDLKCESICELIGDNVSRYGCYSEHFSFVQYRASKFTYWPIIGDANIGISDEFSGCALVKFTINEQKYIGHLSIESGSTWKEETWADFVKKSGITEFILFYPFRGCVNDFITKKM